MMKSLLEKNSALTSYDLVKTFAVIIMIVDHLGYYGFVESDWARAIGRVGFPVWFFLVGYARGRDIPTKLLGGACILLVFNVITGMPIFALNALFTIIFIRLFIDFFAKIGLRNMFSMLALGAALFVLAMPTDFITEYGTMGLITAMYGYYVRNKDKIEDDKFVLSYMLFSFSVFIIYQQIMFGFTTEQFVVMAAGTLIVRLYLLNFEKREHPELTKICPYPLYSLTRFCGRFTLEIYVVHLILFKMIALYFGYKGFELFQLEFFHHELVSMIREIVQ